MIAEDIESHRYPIGKFKAKENYTAQEIADNISVIEQLPAKLRVETSMLSDEQLDTAYRTNGWTIRQVVHHIADSHLNSYTRFKLALTEETPTIRPYHEDRWAELDEAKHAPVALSLNLIDALHKRWVLSLRNIPDAGFKREIYHPEAKKNYSLASFVHLYAWHSEHHLSHITSLKKRMGW
jgi:hypothetical protein